jgi:hypothetical protein
VVAPPAFPFGSDVVAYGETVGHPASLDLMPGYSAFPLFAAKHSSDSTVDSTSYPAFFAPNHQATNISRQA